MPEAIPTPAGASGTARQPHAAPPASPRPGRIALVGGEESVHRAVRQSWSALAPDFGASSRLSSHQPLW